MEEDLDFEGDSGVAGGDHLSPLRPSKYEHEHISRLQVFSDDLQEAIQTSFPRSAHPYTAVTVLLLRWIDDDLNIQVELDRLRDVFDFQFKFATEQWNIPSKNPTRALQTKLYDFQEAHQSESELLVVYYGGHGEASRRGKSVWAATRRQDSPTLAWSSLQHLLENAIPRVLIILDCCFAANAARDTAEGSTKEILAACGRENPTTGVGHRSFTSALIEELHSFGNHPFTVAMLHSRLVTMRWRLQFTPIYALLSEHGGNSIHLAPLPTPRISETHTSLQDHGDHALADDPMDLSSNDESPFSASVQQSSQSSVTAGPETRVLLAVSIQQDAVRDVSQWVTWLTTQAPWDVTKVEVKVEGAYESHSTLVLVSIPIYAWDGLPDKEAYRFIAFIRSSNLQQPRRSSRLASKALSANNKDHNIHPRIPVSRYRSTKSVELSAEEPTVALQKYHQTIKRHGKDETAVMKADSERDLDSGGASTTNVAGLCTNAEVDEHSYDALAYPTPNDFLDVSQVSISSSADIASRNSESQPKPRGAKQSNLWIANSGPVTYHIAGRRTAKSGALSKNHRSQPYPSIGTSTTMASPISPLADQPSSSWSAQDDQRLMRARQRGMNWAPIARDFFPAKSANACRKRHERLKDTVPTSEEWAPHKPEELARLYLGLREQMWSLVATRLGESWKTVEAKCMELGVKTLQSTVRRSTNTTGVDEGVDVAFDDSGLGLDADQEQQSKSYPGHASTRPPPNNQFSMAELFPPAPEFRFEDSWPRSAKVGDILKGTSRAQYTVDNQALYTPPPSNSSSYTKPPPRRRA